MKRSNTPEHCRDYCDAVSTTTVNNYLCNLKAFFHWLEVMYPRCADPTKKVKLLHSERKPKEYMEDEDKECYRSLTYKYMEDYILTHTNAAVNME